MTNSAEVHSVRDGAEPRDLKQFINSVLWPAAMAVHLTGTVVVRPGRNGQQLRWVRSDVGFWYANGTPASEFFLPRSPQASHDTKIVFALQPASPEQRVKKNNPDLLEARLVSVSQAEYEKAKRRVDESLCRELLERRLQHLESEEKQTAARCAEMTAEAEAKVRQLASDAEHRQKLLDERLREAEETRQKLESQKLALDEHQEKLEDFERRRQEFESSALFRAFQRANKKSDRGAPSIVAPLGRDFLRSDLYRHLDDSLPEHLVQSFLLSLGAAVTFGQFLVLCGRTGVGKTSLITRTAQLLGAGCQIIPVRPAWIDPSDVLGFIDPNNNRFVPTPFIDALLDARDDEGRLHFVGLDEMNLSRPENYAADILSMFEKAREGDAGAHLRLYSTYYEDAVFASACTEDNRGSGASNPPADALNLLRYPAQMPIPPNLVLFGTLNLDESAHAVSPKLLDRSCVIQFEASGAPRAPKVQAKDRGRPLGRSLGLQDFGGGFAVGLVLRPRSRLIGAAPTR